MSLTQQQIEKIKDLMDAQAQEGFTFRVYFSETGTMTLVKEHNLQAWSQQNYVWRSSGQYWLPVEPS